MPEILVTDRAGSEHKIDAQPGKSLMQNLCDEGIDEVLALCGGVCSCATCHVYVDPQSVAALPPCSDDEDQLLEGSAHRTAQSRLSCQLPVTDAFEGLRITIAPEDD